MAIINVNEPDSGALTKTAERFLMSAQSIVIDGPEMYGTAAGELQAIKGKAKALETQRVSLVAPLNEVVKRINDMFRAPLDFLGRAESTIKNAMICYDTEQERIAAEARRKAGAEAAAERARIAREAAAVEAKARAEEDRLRAEAQAAERKAAEARAEEARIRREAEEAAAAGDKARAAELEAQAKAESKAAQAADVEAARSAANADSKAEAAQVKADDLAIQSAAVQVAPVTAIEAARPSGIVSKGKWKAQVIDKAKLVAYIAENPQYLELLKVDESAINKLAGALKATMALPGVRAYEERQIASRAV
ncbi:MAG TPA: hypothetical protein VFQ99_06905 [Gallionella sp.]|nr:hypothetical protein [Gallionella sp.]